jgi:hypothetical protein
MTSLVTPIARDFFAAIRRNSKRSDDRGCPGNMNNFILSRTTVSMLVAGSALVVLTAKLPECLGDSPSVTQHWTADNGNGTYSNPLFFEEFEDPDVIRVGEDYYLAGTTMHMNPAVQLMHSKDLVNWELVGYCMDRLNLGPEFPYFVSPGTSHEWLTWRHNLSEFAPLLFRG